MEVVATILLARNGESEGGGWIQLVIFVILGLVYALGGLAKMKAKKAAETEDQDKADESPKRRPRYKPLDSITLPRQTKPKRAPAPQQRVSRITPRPARQISRPTQIPVYQEHKRVVRVPEVKKEQVRPVAKTVLTAVKEPAPSSVVSPELGSIEKLKVEVSRKPKKEKLELAGKPVLDYENRDALRGAIVHYEIFGKPLSLREPTQHIWEL